MSSYRIHRTCPLLVLAASVVTGACGDPGPSPVMPSALVVSAGDHQAGPVGVPLPIPLQVALTGTDGRPFSGAVVTWRLTSGDGSMSPDSATTDASGIARTTLTLGPTIGVDLVSASVAGIAPVSITATALDRCDRALALPYSIGATATGTLAQTDCAFPDGSFVDYFALGATTAQSLRFSLTSSSLNAFLALFDGHGSIVAVNDDDGTSSNAAIRILAQPDSYFVAANSYAGGETGPYTLSSTAVPEEIGPCQHAVHVWVTVGIQTTQQAQPTDCVDTFGRSYDHVLLVLNPGQRVTVAENSTAFDAVLQLWDLSASPDALVASDDNSGGGTNALLSFTDTDSVPRSYAIWAIAAQAGAVGAYTLSITSSSAGAQVRAHGNAADHLAPFKPLAKRSVP